MITKLFRLILLMQLILPIASYAQSEAVSNGLDWLKVNQAADGSWSSTQSSSTDYYTTVSVLDSLAAIGETTSTAYTNGLTWTRNALVEGTTYIAPRVRVMAALGADATTDLNTLLSYYNAGYGWGGDTGHSPTIFHTALALQALKAGSYSDPTVIYSSLAYLTTNQNSDGGWGFAQGDDSNIYMTAVVSATLQQFPQVSTISTAVNKASAYLTSHQNADGGFGASESTPYETALAFSALVAVSSNSPALSSAINYLTSTQSADGSWQEDPYSTALALKALYYFENKPASPPAPPAGGTITGVVVDAVTKARVPGVGISLPGNSLINSASDSSGSFMLSNVPPGAQSVSFSLTGYAAKTVSTEVVVDGGSNLGNVALLSSYSTGYIAGTITDSAGKPVADASVAVSGAWSGSAATGPDGSYSFSYVIPGDVTITAAKTGYLPVTGSGTVYARTKLAFSPRLSATAPQGTTGTLVGRVVDSYWGVPIGHLPEDKGVTVTVSGGISVEPDDGGYFTIRGLAPNTYQVIVGVNGVGSQTFRAVVLPGVTTDLGTIRLEMTVTEMTLTGTITDAVSGAPIPGAEVAIVGSELAGRADFAGTYAIAGIKVDSELSVKVSANGYTGRTIVMNPAPWTHTIDFSLEPQVTTGGLSGTVVDAISNMPLEGVALSLADNSAVATTGADGVFNFRSLSPGTHDFTLSLRDYNSRVLTTPITVGSVSDVGRIAISTDTLPASIQGRVWDAPANAPFTGVAVKAVGTNAVDTVSAPDGSYRIENIDPGSVTIATGTVPKTGYGSARFSAQLAPGGVLVFNPVLSTSVPATVDLSMQSDKDMYKVGERANVAVHVQNRQSVDTPATLYLQVFDPYGATIFESSSDVLVPADGQSDLPVSVALPAAAVPGTYRMFLSAYAPDGLQLRDSVAGFGVAVSQVAITPMLPPGFSGGANTLSFSLNNQGILPVSAGNLVVTLKDPDGQVVSSTATPFSLDPGGTVNLAPTVTFPALKLGNYTLAYVVNDETRNGVATELQVPSSFSIAGLYDDTSRRVRNTANLTVSLGNTGKINVPAGFSGTAATVTVSVPDAGYSETKQLSALPAVGGVTSTSVAFSFVIPETISAGLHATKITMTLPSGSSLSQSAWLTITESALSLASVQGTYTAGNIIHTAFANSGGVDTQLQYRMSLYDAKSMLIAEKSATEGIVAGSTLPTDLAIPVGAVDGNYNFVIAYADTKTGKEAVAQNPITVRGVKGTLQVQTGKETYLLTEKITGASTISNSGTSLDGGMLHLQVVTGPGSEKKKTWTTQADFQTGVRNGVDTFGVNDWIIPDDDFNQTEIDLTKWKKQGSASIKAGKLAIDCSVVPSFAESNWQLEGDFDIQVDFESNNSIGLQGAEFGIKSETYWVYLHNLSAGGVGSGIYVDGSLIGSNSAGSYAASGRFRIVRKSSTITTYYWSGSSWVEVFSGSDTKLLEPGSARLWIWSGPGVSSASTSFDNLKINSGQIKKENQTVDSIRLLPLNDNFDSATLNNDRWLIDTPGCTPLSNGSPACNAWQNNGKLEMKTIGNISGYEFITATHRNNWIQGDFDVHIDYTNMNLTESGWMYSFMVYFYESPGIKTAYHWYDHRWSSKSYNVVYRDASNTADLTASSVATTDNSGRLRLKRVGDLLYWYYWNKLANRWEWNGNPNGFSMKVPLTPVKVAMSTVKIMNVFTSPDVLWDNLVVSPQKYPYSGTIKLKHDSGKTSAWKAIQYMADSPQGTSIRFRTRTAETEAGLTTAIWSDYFSGSGSLLKNLPARWIEIETTLLSEKAQVTPTLHDISVTHEADPEQILWQTDVPVNLAASAQADFNNSIGTLGFVGKLYLQGTLTSSTGQTVATSEYPFFVEQGNFQMVLTPDKQIYRPGETVTINGESMNLVSLAATGLTLQIKDAVGTILYAETYDLPANGSHPFSFTTIAGSDGIYSLKGTLIQNGATIADVTDQYEVGSPNVAATMTVPDSVGSDRFQVAITLTNSGKTEAVVTIAKSFDTTAETLIIPAGETRALQYDQQITAETTYIFTVTGDLSQTLTKTVLYTAPPLASTVTGKVTTDKAFYNPNQQATLTSTLTATSFMENLSLLVTVTNSQGQAVYTDTTAIAQLNQGQITTIKKYWNVGANSAATYLVTLQTLNSAGAVTAKSTCNLVIATATKPTALLKGQVTLDKQSIFTGEPVAVAFNVTNTGNIDLAAVGLSIQTINVSDQAIYSTTADQTSLSIGTTHSGNGTIDTQNYSARDYLVVLRATIDGVEETIGGTYFRVEGAPSAPALVAPAAGADVETFTPTFTVSNAADPNDDRLIYQFEVYTDSSLTSLAASGEVPGTAGMTTWATTIPLVENQTYYWRARAYDGRLYGMWMDIASFRVNTVNDPPSAPTVSSPVDGSEVAVFNPVLAVNNVTDPDSAELTYNLDVSLDPEFTQIVASVKGNPAGEGTTSWAVPVNLQENTSYYWRAQADDWLVEGPWSATAAFFVNTANDAPSAPAVVAPVSGATVATLATDILIRNSVDPDSTILFYYFEADTKATFDSVDLIRSGGIAEGEGGTAWHISGLKDNSRYFVRVKGSDGAAESTWSAVSQFLVNTVNDPPTPPVLANPSDGSGVTVLNPTLSVHNATDLDHDVLSYQFAVYADAAMTELVTGTEAVVETGDITSWQIPQPLTENMTYYWRARAFDGVIHGDWMPAAAFTVNTANDAPSAPKLYSPVDSSSVEKTTPLLQIVNAADPDDNDLTYDFEIYSGTSLVAAGTNVPGDNSGVTSWTPGTALADNSVYQWRARAYDGESYGPWTSLASFTVHVPTTSINAAINFDPDTLNRQSGGTWVVVYVELPSGYRASDIDISTVRLEGSVPAEVRPYSIGDYDKDGRGDLMVKFKRSDVIGLLPAGDKVPVHVSGKVGEVTFEGVDVIRVIK